MDWRLTTMNLHELVRRLQAGETRNAISRAMSLSVNTVTAYRRWAEEASPVAERPIMRVLDLTLRDVDFDAQEGHEHFKG